MMIVDAFTFFNELDLLELRLSELYDVVDRFVLVEAGMAHSGQGKEMLYRKNRERFSRFNDKIIRVGLSDLPPIVSDTEESRIRLESFQRNAIMLGLFDARLQPDDIVMISDLDEIPSRHAVDFVKQKIGGDDIYTLIQRFHKYYLDEELDDGYNRRDWGGTTACRFRTLSGTTPQAVRRERGVGGQIADPVLAAIRGSKLLYRGGWHLSSFGGDRAARVKVAHYIHGAGSPGIPVEPVPGPADGIGGDEARLLEAAIRRYLTQALAGDAPRTLFEAPLKYRHFFKSLRSGPA